jgi:Tfp pilus assembly protein PilO
MITPYVMNEKLWDKAKQAVLVILLGALFSVVPFYFQTLAMTEKSELTNLEQSTQISETLDRIQKLELKDAVNDTEIKQIKESLVRIEKKIDRLIDEDK